MKKLMFLTMIFGLMMIFSGSVSAQKTILFAVNGGSGTPAVNQQLKLGIHARLNNEKDAPAGSKYFLFTFLANGKGYASAQSLIPEADQKNFNVSMKETVTLKKVENPIAFRAYDGLKISAAGKNGLSIEVIRSNKSVGVMKVYW